MPTTANHVLLRRVTLPVDTASVVIDSIPQSGYTDLKLVMTMRETSGSVNSGNLKIKFNTSTSDYITRTLYGSGTGTASQNPVTTSVDAGISGGMPTSGNTADTFASVEVYVSKYLSSNYKSVATISTGENNTTNSYLGFETSLWSNVAAIYSMTMTCSSSFAVGSSFALYGIADANTTPTVVPKASGGDIVVNDGTYWYHAFLASGTFTPQTTLSCNAIVVAGGGGGGQQSGGGGGAGGLQAFTNQSFVASPYTVIIGSGGAGSSTTAVGTNGSSSQIGSLTAAVGGGGGGTQGGTSAGQTGGSGGGGTYSGGAGGSATSGQGYAGGSGSTTAGSGGGGGGASAAGTTALSASPYSAGAGGTGSNTYSSWATATGTGASGYYAGGGGGGNNGTASYGTGGSGGGGRGANTSNTAVSGTVNTGGGGGGGCDVGTRPTGGTGGSGIVIIRYAMA